MSDGLLDCFKEDAGELEDMGLSHAEAASVAATLQVARALLSIEGIVDRHLLSICERLDALRGQR